MEESVTVVDVIFGLLSIPALVIQLVLIWWIFRTLQRIRDELNSMSRDLALPVRRGNQTGGAMPRTMLALLLTFTGTSPLYGQYEREQNDLRAGNTPASEVSASTRVSTAHEWIQSPITQRQILTHVFVGPLATATAETEITITNRTGDSCKASILFHRGTEEAPAVRFNGQYRDGNRMSINIKGGTVHRILLTAGPGQNLAVGAVYVEQEAECLASDLQVEGRYLIIDREGQIEEVFSVLPQSENDWLSDGECRILQNAFGSQDNIGLAMVTAQVGEAAPPDTRLTFQAYDWQGEFVSEPPSLEVTGEQHGLNPWEFNKPRMVKLCLDAAGDPDFRLPMIAIAAKTSRRSVQYSNSALMQPGQPTAAQAGQVVVAGTDAALGLGDDDYVLNNAMIAGDTLTISVSYAGGCERHAFILVISASFIDSSPVQLPVVLRHEANGDSCEAWLTQSYAFDLAIVRSRYRETYGSGAGRVLLQLDGVPADRLVYEFSE